MTQPELPNMPAPVFDIDDQSAWPMPPKIDWSDLETDRFGCVVFPEGSRIIPPLTSPVFVFPDAPTFGHIDLPKPQFEDLDMPDGPDVTRFDWPNSVPPIIPELPSREAMRAEFDRLDHVRDNILRQSRMESFIEVCINTAIGLCISVVANQLVFPLFGFHPSLGENVLISVIYTAISIARGYAVRRWFERRIKRAAHALARGRDA